MLFHLFSELCYAIPYLLHTLFISIYVLFINSGSWIKVTALICSTTLASRIIKSLLAYSALPSPS